MKNKKDDEILEEKIYEPPQLFDLSGGGAYIGTKVGGSGFACRTGTGAAKGCLQGNSVSGRQCVAGAALSL